ncbi:hypothetical protein LCGC14_0370300 [marine sediment metagenome]|uniref:Large polyvalent protein associated domain-containing protein n=1 Tax=marine sediment metagenome TaxID=412755 RepID=A0A0F9VSS7_9ZZZZ
MVTPRTVPPFFEDISKGPPRESERVRERLRKPKVPRVPPPTELELAGRVIEDVEAPPFLTPEQVREQFGIEVDPQFKGRVVDGTLRFTSPLGEDLALEDVIVLPGGRWVSQFQAQREIGGAQITGLAREAPPFGVAEREEPQLSTTQGAVSDPEGLVAQLLGWVSIAPFIQQQREISTVFIEQVPEVSPEAFINALNRMSREDAVRVIRTRFPEATASDIQEILSFTTRLTQILASGDEKEIDRLGFVFQAAFGFRMRNIDAVIQMASDNPDQVMRFIFNMEPSMELRDVLVYLGATPNEINSWLYPPKKDFGTLSNLWRVLEAGTGDVIKGLGGFTRMMGAEGMGKAISQFGETLQERAPTDDLGPFHWSMVFNPEFWIHRGTRMVPFVASIILPGMMGGYAGAMLGTRITGLGEFGIRVMKYSGAGGSAAFLEAASEAGNTFDAALNKRMGQGDAAEAGWKSFFNNLVLLGVTNTAQFAMLFSRPSRQVLDNLVGRGWVRFVGKTGAVALTEGGQEVVQDIINRLALGEDVKFDAEMQQALVLGLALGGGMKLTVSAYQAIVDNTIASMKDEALKEQFETDKADGIKQGLDEAGATQRALDNYAKTPEGQKVIENVVKHTSIDIFEQMVKPESKVDALVMEETFDAQRAELEPITEVPIEPARPPVVAEVPAFGVGTPAATLIELGKSQVRRNPNNIQRAAREEAARTGIDRVGQSKIKKRLETEIEAEHVRIQNAFYMSLDPIHKIGDVVKHGEQDVRITEASFDTSQSTDVFQRTGFPTDFHFNGVSGVNVVTGDRIGVLSISTEIANELRGKVQQALGEVLAAPPAPEAVTPPRAPVVAEEGGAVFDALTKQVETPSVAVKRLSDANLRAAKEFADSQIILPRRDKTFARAIDKELVSREAVTPPVTPAEEEAVVPPPAKVPPVPPKKPPKKKPPVEPAVPPPTESASDKLVRLVKEAKPAREETEVLKSEELAKKAAKAAGILETGEGRAAFERSKSALVGELPKADFEAPEAQLSEEEVKDLYNFIRDSNLRYFDKLNTAAALGKVLTGQIPTRGEIKLLEDMFGANLAKALLDKRSLSAKAWEEFLDLINLPRAVLASWDLSAPLRQGALLFWGQPLQSFPNLIPMVKAFASEKATITIAENIAEGKHAALRAKTPLHQSPLFGVSATLVQREEAFMSRYARLIPLVRRSERAYVTFLNKLRADVFDSYAEHWEGTGKTQKDYNKLAEAINVMTGRGDLGKLSNLAPILSAVFFSPRYQAAKIQLPITFLTATNPVRKMMARNIVAFVVANFAILSLIKLAGGDVEDDPRSSDFGKGKIGNTRLDFWAGYQQYARAVTQIATEMRKVSSTGRLDEVERADIMVRFVRGKLSPVAGFVTDILVEETFMGDELSLEPKVVQEQAFNRLVPLFIQDLVEAIEDVGWLGALEASPGLLGVGVQTYGGGYWDEFLDQLGEPIPVDTLPYSVNKEEIYTTKHFYSDVLPRVRGMALEDIDPKFGFPELAKAVVEAKGVKKEYELRPSDSLIRLNENEAEGDTFEQFHLQWLAFQKAKDKEQWVKDNSGLDEYFKGNFSQRALSLLRRYHKAEDKKAFLKSLSDEDRELITSRPRNEWLKANPLLNAQLAVFSQAKLLTQEAYDEFQRLIKVLDIPSNAIEKTTLPPPAAIESYFKYNDAVAEFAASSAEALVIRAENEALQKWGAEVFGWEDIDTPVESLKISVEWRDQDDAFDAIKGDTDEETQELKDKYRTEHMEWSKADWTRDAHNKGFEDVDGYTERAEIVFNTSSGSIETRVFMLEHPELIQEGLDLDVWTEDFKDDSLDALKLRVMQNDKFEAYDAIDSEDREARDAYLEAHTQFRDDRRRIEMFEWGVTDETLIDQHVEYNLLDGVGANLYRFDNPNYNAFRMDTTIHGEQALKEIDESRVPIWRIDVEFRDQDEEYNDIKSDDPVEQREARDEFLEDNEGYRMARREREAYEIGVTDTGLVEAYVAYYELPTKGFRQERFLKDNSKFYNEVYRNKDRMNLAKVDFTKIPDVQFDDLSEEWADEIAEFDAVLVRHRDVGNREEHDRLVDQDRKTILDANPGLFEDMLRIEAYATFFPRNSVENYVEYYSILEKERPEGWRSWEDERYLKEHRGFYTTAKNLLGWTRVIDWDKIATERFETLYNETYLNLRLPNGKADSEARQAMRWETRDDGVKWFDKEGLKLGIFTSPVKPLPTSIFEKLREQGLLEEFGKRFR